MEIRKIVVGTDFSAGAQAALEASLDIARHLGAEIILIRATTIPKYDSPEFGERSRWKRALGSVLDEHRAMLGELRERYGGRGVELSHMVIDAMPAQGLLKAADELGADLIAVGTHGRTGLRRALLGSVAAKVVRHASTNVLVARPRKVGGGYRGRILVPSDFSASATLALDAASNLVTKGGEIEILHCLRLPSEIAAHWVEGPSEAKRNADSLKGRLTSAAQGVGRGLLEAISTDRFKAGFYCTSAHPNEGIQDELEAESFDMVVMGSRGRQGLKRWLLGSVAEHTVRHSPCSVLVVREAAARPRQREAEGLADG